MFDIITVLLPKEELLQAEIQNTQCENEHVGYVRSMGLGITPSRISSRSTRSASSSIEANEKMLKMQAEIDSLKDKASQVDILKAQVAFLMQMQEQNSRDKESVFADAIFFWNCHNSLENHVKDVHLGLLGIVATPFAAVDATVLRRVANDSCDPNIRDC
ncbi:hypothetical protein MTR_4g088560 [Medicago truncatula]|uniref:Uncharacterized protein n=1 Tax=Medicago truncatula TaxID=3880 RepID=A0A072UNS3_MEDTR|nr:hypothetical protein MTR_4g088560 [Medicago truncatula]